LCRPAEGRQSRPQPNLRHYVALPAGRLRSKTPCRAVRGAALVAGVEASAATASRHVAAFFVSNNLKQ
jgi:hypothetical protein